jgi:hypothetical protein
MSSKCSISYISEDGDEMHAYTDCFDNGTEDHGTVYVEVFSLDDIRGLQSLIVAFSPETWEQFEEDIIKNRERREAWQARKRE